MQGKTCSRWLWLVFTSVLILAGVFAAGCSKQSPPTPTATSTAHQGIKNSDEIKHTSESARTDTGMTSNLPENVRELIGYDQDANSVRDEEELFRYFRQVTGGFLEIRFFVPDIHGGLQAINLHLDNIQKFANDTITAMGQGVIINNAVLTVSHVAEQNETAYSIFSLGMPSPLDIILPTRPSYTQHVLEGGDGKKYKVVVSSIYGDYSYDSITGVVLLTSCRCDWSPEGYEFNYSLESTLFPPVIIGDSAQLRLGDFVYIVTNREIKEGVVIPPQDVQEGWDPAGLFTAIRLHEGFKLKQGDSSASVFALRKGSPELVALIQAAPKDNPRMGIAINSVYFKDLFSGQ